MTSMISSISRPIPKFQYTLYLIVNLRYYDVAVAALRGTNSGPERSAAVRNAVQNAVRTDRPGPEPSGQAQKPEIHPEKHLTSNKPAGLAGRQLWF